jgi:hypothetical protein
MFHFQICSIFFSFHQLKSKNFKKQTGKWNKIKISNKIKCPDLARVFNNIKLKGFEERKKIKKREVKWNKKNVFGILRVHN